MTDNKIKVLLIEDNQADVRLIKEMLADRSYVSFDLVCVDRLKTGLNHFAKANIHIILLDLGLPDSQGLDTFIKIQNIYPDIPIVVLTGLNDEKIGIEAVQKGAQDYLIKGQVDSHSLIHSIFYAIERKKAEDELKKHREHLEKLVEERTAKLTKINQKLQREITESKKIQEKFVHQEKLAVLGQLAAGVGHELRNPLGAIKNASYFLNMALKKTEPDVQETLEFLEKEVAASEKIINSLIDFAHPKTPILRKININNIILDVLSHGAAPENIEVIKELNEDLPVILADPDHLKKVFANIILNAIQAMPGGGKLVVKSELESPKQAAVSIKDTGRGISKENLKRLFEPLFTTKAKGIGFGLGVAKALIEGHGGTLGVESEVGRGSTFTVRLPI